MKTDHRASRCVAALALSLVISVAPATAQEKPAITISAMEETTLGTAYEYVFHDNLKLSELDWPLMPAFQATCDVEARWNGGLRVNLDLSAGLPVYTGLLTDRDFLNVPINGDTGLTKLSVHEAYLDYLFRAGLSASWASRRENRQAFVGTVGVRYLTWQWAGWNGYRQYATFNTAEGVWNDWTEDIAKLYAYSGKVITYRQQFLIPYLSYALELGADDGFRLIPSITVSPYLWGVGADNHITSNVTYYDIVSGGYLLEPALQAIFPIGPKLELIACAQWTYIGLMRGDTYTQTSGSDTAYLADELSSGAGGGAAVNAGSLQFGVNIGL
jgi:outer membrane protease